MSQLDQATTLAHRIAQADLDGQPYGTLRTELVDLLERQIMEQRRDVQYTDTDVHLCWVTACSRADRLVQEAKTVLAAQTTDPEIREKITSNLDASKYGYAGTHTVVATDPAALKLYAEGNSIPSTLARGQR